MVYVLVNQSDLPPNLLSEIFAMQKDACLLAKQSHGLTQRFVNEWNSRKKKQKDEEGGQ